MFNIDVNSLPSSIYFRVILRGTSRYRREPQTRGIEWNTSRGSVIAHPVGKQDRNQAFPLNAEGRNCPEHRRSATVESACGPRVVRALIGGS